MCIIIYSSYRSTRRLNFKIIEQNNDLAASKEEIEAQNEELVQFNEEILSQREVIDKQNRALDEQNDNLKSIVKKRTEELVQYIQQLEQFTFISSHNLRAPAARILGLGNLLELQGINGSDAEIIHKSLIASTRELDRVISDLSLVLEIRKKNDIFLTTENLHEIIQTVRISIQNEITNNSALIFEDFDAVKEIKSFRPYLVSILLNLISNSIKYRRPEISPVIKITSFEKKKYYCINVSDNGLGIDLKLHSDKIFTLYKRFHDHVEGKGLGLYMVKTQLAMMSGKIKVKSELNLGTTFSIFLKKEKPKTSEA